MGIEHFDCISLSTENSAEPLITDTSCQLTEWLQNNDLPDLVSIFENEQITLQTLIDLDNSNVLDEYLSALNIKIALTRKLILISKLRKIPQDNNINNNNNNISFQSEIEQHSISKLHERNENICKLLKELNNSYWKIKKQSIICQKEIKLQFKGIINKLCNKQNEMIKKIKQIEKNKLNKINTNIKQLENEEIKINISIKTFDQLFIENMNVAKRKEKIQCITHDILKNNLSQSNYLNELNEQFTVSFNRDVIKPFLSSICAIEYGHPLPIINDIHIQQITTNAATVKWTAKLAKMHENIQSSSKLFIGLECNIDNDKHEKKEEENIKFIAFNVKQTRYFYKFVSLEKNEKYVVNISIFEETNKVSNNKLKRKDFQCISMTFNTLNSSGKDGVLIINSNQTKILKSDYEYEFGFVFIENGGILTVNNWDSSKQKGGILKIKCLTNFIISKHAKIDLNGKGYKGGNKYWTGESYKKPSIKHGHCNLGGGGGGGIDRYGGGGGYGSNGHSNTHPLRKYDKDGGNGGIIYGDKELNICHLGSGGGGYSNDGGGGDGGGALKIECKNGKFENYGQILVNGSNCNNYGDGAGSGGSIYIICNTFVMNINNKQNNFISACACGGNNKYELGGKGGDGRIKIKSIKTANEIIINNYVNSKQIKPSPYIE